MRTARPLVGILALLGAIAGLVVYAGRGGRTPSTAPPHPHQNPDSKGLARRFTLLIAAVIVLGGIALAAWQASGLLSGGSPRPISARAPTTPVATATAIISPTAPPPATASPAPADVQPTEAPVDVAPRAQAQTEPPAQQQEPPPTSPPPTSMPPPPIANNAPPPPEVSGVDAAYTAAVLARINQERTSRGAPAVSVNGALQSAAESYSTLLTQLHTLSHDAGGLDLGARVAAAGYSGGLLAEILWYGGGVYAPDETVDAWLASPGHRDIMLDPAYTAAGAACYIYIAGDDHETRCVVDFGG